jgi:hypothetical protein
MTRTDSVIRSLVLLGLLAFLPLVYYLAVVGGLLPFGAILLIAIRNINDPSFLLFSVIHLAVYGVVVVLLLAGIGLLPIFGIAHGQIQWRNAYALYASDTLR